MDLFEYGRSRNTDPSTSHDAGKSINASKLEMMVLVAIKNTGNHGATWYELESLTGLDKASISPRFAPLREKGLICAKKNEFGEIEKRRGKTRRQQIVWVIDFGREKQ